MKIEIKYDDREVREALERLRKAGADMEPAMREIAGHLVDGVHEAFERQESPDGKPWAPLKPSTKKERRRKRYRDGPILERSGDLLSRILPHHDDTTAMAGTNTVYAATQHFGAKKGQFRGGDRPIPWGDVGFPALAGMDPHLAPDRISQHRIPRARGDGPSPRGGW